MKTDKGNRLVAATRTMAGAFIDVYLSSEQGAETVRCAVQRINPSGQGWLVSHCGSTEMPVKWSWKRCGWVFHYEPDPLMKHLLNNCGR